MYTCMSITVTYRKLRALLENQLYEYLCSNLLDVLPSVLLRVLFVRSLVHEKMYTLAIKDIKLGLLFVIP